MLDGPLPAKQSRHDLLCRVTRISGSCAGMRSDEAFAVAEARQEMCVKPAHKPNARNAFSGALPPFLLRFGRGVGRYLDAFADRASEGSSTWTNAVHPPDKLFQFPRMFAIPNFSPFCCKLEIWLAYRRRS